MEKTVSSRGYQVFLDLLKEARQTAGLTQIDLAERLGVTQSFVSKCERGERRLDLLEIRTWCLAMDLPFVAFVQDLDARLPRESRNRASRRGPKRRP